MNAVDMLPSARIMLVEDERIVALHLQQQLSKFGYEVVANVSSGEQALKKVDELRPDLILMDIHIEGPLDGIETAARIPSDKPVPVIYLTAYSEEATLERARKTKPYGYLLKPFSERELHATIQMVMERRRTEIALSLSEDRLRQAQKMQVVGQLAGGVAHDFNNILAVIIGNLELVEDAVEGQDEVEPFVDSALKAAERGASLTHQLLAYSRMQPLEARVIDIDRLINALIEMLKRTLGETVQVSAKVPAGIWPVRIDPNQLENALLNLAVNARDAMPAGGRLMIEAENVDLDQTYAEQYLEVAPGRYVLVTVTDTGSGMTREVAERALEPFFTTKPVGQGTGLGLSMVYGFVKQSNGHLKIYSEPGLGTAVKLYLPAETGDAARAPENAPEHDVPLARRGEVVLIVEDDPMVRRLTVQLLNRLGYNTIEAGDGPAAVAIMDEHSRIDLLFTDVVLPKGMNGPAVARAASAKRPGLKVLYMSGYTADAIGHHGVLDKNVRLVTKPFRRAELATKVREAIDSAN